MSNLSEISIQNTDDIGCDVSNKEDNDNCDNPVVKKKGAKKNDFKKKYTKNKHNGIWLPYYAVSKLSYQIMRFKLGIPNDSKKDSFLRLIHEVLDIQRSESDKKRNQQIIDEEKKKFDYYDEELERKLLNGEEPGFKGFDSPINIHDDHDFNKSCSVESFRLL